MNKPSNVPEQHVILNDGETYSSLEGCVVVQWSPDKVSEDSLEEEERCSDIRAIASECGIPSPKGRTLRIDKLVELYGALEDLGGLSYEPELAPLFDSVVTRDY